jgi:hypothetical protein
MLFVKEEDITSTHRYCKNMNWQNSVGVLTFFLINYIGPWNISCYGVESYSGNEPKDIAYREKAIKEHMIKEAIALGGNAVIGLEYGGEALVEVGSGSVLSTSSTWSGQGFIVKL